MNKRLLTIMAMASLASVQSQQTFAQSAATVPLLTLRGSTFDSLTGRPLAAATVRIAGRIDTQVSDAQGLFKFDSIPAGAYLLIMEHPRLDSLGLPEVATRISISRERQDATVAVPSFATLWRGVCGARKAPTDSGLV